MTNEEAILHMTLRREELKHSVSDLDEDIKAFDMAIKALEQEPKTDIWSIKDIANTFKKHGLIREQEPCEDCISRQAVLDALDKSRYSNGFCEEHHIDWSINLGIAHIVVNELKPVTPLGKAEQPKQRVGQWIIIDDCEQFIAKCSECGRIEDSRDISKYPYCHCGAKMRRRKYDT